MAAIRLVGAVVADEMHEVLRRRRPDGHEAAEVHQQAAVAVEHDDAPARIGERETKCVRGGESHRAHGEVVEDARAEVVPLDRRAVGRDHDLIGDVACEHLEAVFSFHHGTGALFQSLWVVAVALQLAKASGLRPMSSATGKESAYAFSIAGLILATSES